MRVSPALVLVSALAAAACGDREGAPLQITTAALTDGYTGSAYSQAVTAKGGTPPYAFTGQLPDGLELEAGLLQGTPTEAGETTLALTVTDANQRQASATLPLAIYTPPSLTFEAPTALYVGESFSEQVAAAGGKAPLTLRISSGTLPPGLSLSSAGAFSGAPTTEGESEFTLTLTDANGRTDSATFSLTVYPTGGVPIFEVASWNLEWFGDTSNGPSNEPLQLQNVTTVIAHGGYDVWAVVEVVTNAQFNALLANLPGYDGFLSNDATIPGGSSEYTVSEQKVGFLYDTNRVEVLSKQLILTSDDFEFAGRPPLQVQARLSVGSTQLDVTFIVVHLKAGATAADRDRRIAAAGLLKGHIDSTLPNAPVLVLGDFNDDVDRSIVSSGGGNYYDTPFRSIIDDSADFRFVTTPLSVAGMSSTVGFNDVIDHHLATNELDALLAGPPEIVRPDQWSPPISSYGNSTSDHYPVVTRYSVAGPAKTVFLNEVLYDEPGSDFGKEFVELVNAASSSVDLTGWTVSDSSQVRHTFAAGTLLPPGKAIVVFGSGAEASGIANAVGASTGQLSFHATDSALLRDADGALVDSLSFSTTFGDGISANRATDGDPGAAWVAHTSLSAAPSSAGVRASGGAW